MKALFRKLRFLVNKPSGYLADGRMMGIGLATALKTYNSAEDVERHVRRWAAEERIGGSRAGHDRCR